MGVRIITEINRTIDSVDSSEVKVSNVIQGVNASNPLLTSNDLVIDHMDTKTWVLDQSQATAFSLDIMGLINSASTTEIKFIHIQCHKVVSSNRERQVPIKFALSLDGSSAGKVSQFSMFDVENFPFSAVTVGAMTLGTDEKCVLTVVFGLDK